MEETNAAGAAGVPKRRRGGYPLIVAAIVGAGVLLVVSSSFSSGTYSLEIAALAGTPDRYEGREVKVVGHIKEGSVETRTEGGRVETHFSIHDGKGGELRVLYPHNPPDPFKEGRQVIVEGVYEEQGHVLCHKLTVKCPSKYQESGGGAEGYSDDYYEEKYGTKPASGGAM